MIVVSIDIGSTWTKGAAFRWRSHAQLSLVGQSSHPTTVQDLSVGFDYVLSELVRREQNWELCYSSSAKGGLAVAAIGLVPDLTAEMARVTACSSGAKLTQSFAYELSDCDIRSLKEASPDIVLLSGGSNGGNTSFPIRNAERIAAANIPSSIVYAGNRNAAAAVARLLSAHDVVCTENLLPTLDTPNPEPARTAIREIFLRKIVSGKGLDKIVDKTGREPSPTPHALYEFCQSLSKHAPQLGEFVLVDMGGATTDVYSYHIDRPVAGIVRRGLPEPTIKRTVEGDLGMRVSAGSALQAAKDAGMVDDSDASEMMRYVEGLASSPDHLTNSSRERSFDAVLAGANIGTSIMRHAGRGQDVATADGVVAVQTGRDLSSVKTLIGTGGHLAHAIEFDPRDHLKGIRLDKFGKRILMPNFETFLRDPKNLLPLLANVSRTYPVAAVAAAVRLLCGDETASHSEIRTKAAWAS